MKTDKNNNTVINFNKARHHGNEQDKARIKLYDFKRPDKFSWDQLRTLQMIHETFMRLFVTSFSGLLRTEVQGNLKIIDQMTFSEFMGTVTKPAWIGIINMHPLNGTSILHTDLNIIYAAVNQLCGGKGKYLKIKKGITDIENSLFTGLINKILPAFNEGWHPIFNLDSQLMSVESNPEFAQIVPPNDMIVLLKFDIRVNDISGEVNIVLPYITIEPVVPKLSAQYWFSCFSQKPGNRINKKIVSLKVETQLYLNTESLSIRDIAGIKRNSLIKLPEYNSGYAFLQTGNEPVLFLQENRNKKKELVYDVQVSTVNEEMAIDQMMTKDDLQNERMISMLKIPLQQYTEEIKKNIGQLNNKINDLANRQDDLAEQVYYSAGVSDNSENDTESLAKGLISGKPFGFLQYSDTEMLSVFLQTEYPQTIALILSYLESNTAAKIIAEFEEEVQWEVIERIAVIEHVAPEVLHTIETVLQKHIKTVASNEFYQSGGINKVVNILNLSSRSIERNVINTLDKKNPELADMIKKNMFVFEDIILLEDRSVQKVLQVLKTDELAKALKGVDKAVQDHLLKNMSKIMQDEVKEKTETIGSVRLKDVERAQQQIIQRIRELEEAGEIFISRADDKLVK